MLAGGAAYPTISSIGPAVVEPRMSPPFLYTPYMAMFGADPVSRHCRVCRCGPLPFPFPPSPLPVQLPTPRGTWCTQFRHKEAQTVGTKLAAERKRQAIVASVAGPGAAKSTTQAGALASAQVQGRRHSALTPAGMGNWNAFMHRNAADTAAKEQKEMEEALAALQADGGTGQKKRRYVWFPLVHMPFVLPCTTATRSQPESRQRCCHAAGAAWSALSGAWVGRRLQPVGLIVRLPGTRRWLLTCAEV